VVASLLKLTGNEKKEYYKKLRREDYYLQARPLTWWGEGANKLGLVGEVKPDDFGNGFLGIGPDGRRVKNWGTDRVSAYDVTLSVDKPTAALFSQAGERERQIIAGCIWKAAEDTLRYLQTVARTRVGAGGSQQIEAPLVVAMTMHCTARATKNDALPSCQPHVHCLVMSMTPGPDELQEPGKPPKLLTQDGRVFYQQQHTLGAIFRASYTAYIEEKLGIEYEKDGSWKWRVKGPE
jgi:conjugative relaxase-like TrwC/TraI family protein